MLIMFVYYIFKTSSLWLAFGPQSLSGGIVIKILNVCPFDYMAVSVSRKVDRFNRFNRSSGVHVAVVSPTDRPNSVHNCRVTVVSVVFLCFTLLIGFFCGCRGFCYRTESDLFHFLWYD